MINTTSPAIIKNELYSNNSKNAGVFPLLNHILKSSSKGTIERKILYTNILSTCVDYIYTDDRTNKFTPFLSVCLNHKTNSISVESGFYRTGVRTTRIPFPDKRIDITYRRSNQKSFVSIASTAGILMKTQRKKIAILKRLDRKRMKINSYLRKIQSSGFISKHTYSLSERIYKSFTDRLKFKHKNTLGSISINIKPERTSVLAFYCCMLSALNLQSKILISNKKSIVKNLWTLTIKHR